MRKILNPQQIEDKAVLKISQFHSQVVDEVEKAIQQNEWVVVGMTQNPVVKKARALLEAKSIPFKYLEYGSYFSMWKERLAIKLWSGWPTFPQVFHKGKLVGGFDDLQKYLKT
jgi:glutaredoxin-related protein